MRFGLARMVLGSPAFLPISKDEYMAIQEAKSGLLEVLFIEQKFDLVVENYLELEVTLLESATRNMILRDQNYRWFQVERGLFNRRLMNLLTAGRTYVDQTKHHLKEIFGPASEIVQSIDAEFSRQYDERLGYRAMESLRNFAQHRGFPVHAVTYDSKWVDRADGDRLLFSVTPYIKPDELRAGKKFKKSVLDELEARGERLDLKSLFREYVEGFWIVHSCIRQKLAPQVQSWDEALSAAIARFRDTFPQEQSIVGLAALIHGEDDQCSGEIPLFEDFVAYRKHLQEKNASLQNLSARYVTSEIMGANKP